MLPKKLQELLDNSRVAAEWLTSLGIQDCERAHGNLVSMATAGITLDLMANMAQQLARELPRSSDPDRALNNLDLFVAASRNPLSLGSLFERDPDALTVLLRIFATSQHLSDLLIADPGGFDLLRLTEGQPVARRFLVDELCAEVDRLPRDKAAKEAIRRFKRRETLRIAYGDIIHEQTVTTVTRQISFLAEAILEAAVLAGRRKLAEKWGEPLTNGGAPARFVILALGKLGGEELNYSSDIDLMFLYDEAGQTTGPKVITNHEYFDRLAREIVSLVSEPTELGAAYRVDLRLRPEGSVGAIVVNMLSALRYYDVMGRTWERQAFVKSRPVAGDMELGQEFLAELQPWIYRRYLSLADITGIKALKRRIEQQAKHEQNDEHDVKTGRGGIRDIEFAIQFLQLLNGGDLPELRIGNTLEAISRLRQVGCLTDQEASLLEKNYCFLRKAEHRLQIMYDLQTHRLPSEPEELTRMARRLGYVGNTSATALSRFEADLRQATRENRQVLDHLLHDAFGEDHAAEPEVDLVLDPAPSEAQIQEVFHKYGFRDAQRCYRNLMDLSVENIPFLSTRRCRHFLASIAPRLLATVAETPDSDQTLTDLSKVSNSLGGKAVLWELFSFNPPTLKLYVELCASSPLLTGILTSNPGMIDELLDSLLLDKLPDLPQLRATLSELCRAAEDMSPILHSFKNTQTLNVGIRDILGKEDITATTAALSNIADACLGEIADREQRALTGKFGWPAAEKNRSSGGIAELVVLGMGKLGGRELNYQSDLDIIFLFDDDGHTTHGSRASGQRTTSNQHFFSELGQRIIKRCTDMGQFGRLYDIDARLRPSGKSGMLATSFAGFMNYFSSGQAQFWERQAICKARPIYGSKQAAQRAMEIVHQAAYDADWSDDNIGAVIEMRRRLENAAPADDLKRGPGGLVDIEFISQFLQIKYGKERKNLREPSTLSALSALHAAGILSEADHSALEHHYCLLRRVESRLRLLNCSSRTELPKDAEDRHKVARFLGYENGEHLHREIRDVRQDIRSRFVCLMGEI